MEINYIRQNSESNLQAAKILYDNKKYAPSVHCAYYSTFQLMKCVIQDFFKCSFEEQEEELKKLKFEKATRNIGVHAYIINKFCTKAKDVSNTDYVIYNRNIKDLQKFRIDSDYKNIEINSTNSELALKKAQEVYYLMVEKFHV
jgi:uncharacterized protein (UPF0332 family)